MTLNPVELFSYSTEKTAFFQARHSFRFRCDLPYSEVYDKEVTFSEVVFKDLLCSLIF